MIFYHEAHEGHKGFSIIFLRARQWADPTAGGLFVTFVLIKYIYRFTTEKLGIALQPNYDL